MLLLLLLLLLPLWCTLLFLKIQNSSFCRIGCVCESQPHL
jgi:hypothetical protein